MCGVCVYIYKIMQNHVIFTSVFPPRIRLFNTNTKGQMRNKISILVSPQEPLQATSAEGFLPIPELLTIYLPGNNLGAKILHFKGNILKSSQNMFMTNR